MEHEIWNKLVEIVKEFNAANQATLKCLQAMDQRIADLEKKLEDHERSWKTTNAITNAKAQGIGIDR